MVIYDSRGYSGPMGVMLQSHNTICNCKLTFRSHWEAFDGITSLAVHLYPMFSAYIFYAFTSIHIGPLVASCCIGTDDSSHLLLVLLCGCINLHFHLI